MRKGGRAGGWTMGVMLFATPGLSFATSSGTIENGGRTVEDQVRHELTSLAYYSVFDDLSFRVDAGKVTLLGEVTQPVVKDDAERAVKKIPGVQAVLNQVEVLPLSRVDDQIRRHVYYAVYAYGPLGRYGLGSQPAIRIIVKNGRVTLTGAVANQMDRDLVFQRASTVPGVFSVTNHLLIEA